ncbi:putative ornithine carbamoyl transferase [Microdochium trichocladiopsis]|uniref:Ornithine carbamoyltransferase, mitochondrial n=1 Tax=Microdochium trichocladiopsis TaxID=1682393 RepID=A0A9P9BW53_9PEZI|nr:putative ornithine carbamoyl transferase [Microdochium trichocladiopsis]KAH7040452.1 putative ornithine carbamoyl transferase [Microdochium trichocladiopsis]
MRSSTLKLAKSTTCQLSKRTYATGASASGPKHLMSMDDVSPDELSKLVLNAAAIKRAVKAGEPSPEFSAGLTGKTVAMMFSKLSTRTRVSTEAAVAMMGGHPMFLGKNDIQLGVSPVHSIKHMLDEKAHPRNQVNESLLDTSKVISSMTSCMVARVGPHSDVTELARHSSVPVINALSADFHPLQIIADYLTIHEAFSKDAKELVPGGLKIAWVGDANNVLFDLAIASVKLGVDIAVATPKGYEIPKVMEQLIQQQAGTTKNPGKLIQTNVPEEAVKNADILVTDTWVSMGQEEETKKRLQAFSGFQITSELAKRGGAKSGWKFMHCLPRHQEEVADEVFYSDRSLVFPEAENRLWAAASALQSFVVNKGKIM